MSALIVQLMRRSADERPMRNPGAEPFSPWSRPLPARAAEYRYLHIKRAWRSGGKDRRGVSTSESGMEDLIC